MDYGKLIINVLMFTGIVLKGVTYSQEADPVQSTGNNNADEYIQLCKTSLQQEKPEEAVEYAKKAIELDDSCSQYYYWLGQAYGIKAQKASIFGKMPNAKKCKEAWLKAVELDPKNLDARFGLFNYYLQVPGIAGGGKDKAIKEAEEITNINPVSGHIALAQVYESEEKFREAEQEYIQATEVNPEDTGPYFNLGFFYQKQEKFDKAEDTFQKILNQKPDDTDALYQLGKTKLLSGKDLDKGITCFEKYLKKEPTENNANRSYAHWRLGMIYEKLENKEQAKAEYQKALELYPGNKEAKEVLEKIDS
ncbi:MAG: tetratricopeptide repeat protein [bacterium]